MKTKNALLIVFLLLMIILVSVKSFSRGHFKNNAQKWTAGSVDHSNRITNLKDLAGNILVIDLNEQETTSDDAVRIAPGEILSKDNFKKLDSFDGNIVLVSEDPAISARIWMLLSQMGIKDLYILETSF